MRFRSLAVLALAATALVPAQGHADDPDCTADTGSETNIHFYDDANDYASVIEGRGAAAPGVFGDIHGQAIDLLDTWISKQPGGPLGSTWRANIQVASIEGALAPRYPHVNTRFQLWWTHDVGPEDRTLRFVEMEIGTAGTLSFSHGYLGPGTGGATSGTVTFVGSTTGTLTAGSPATVSIAIPFHSPSLGKPSKLTSPYALSRALAGASAAGGLLYNTDESRDNGPCFEIEL